MGEGGLCCGEGEDGNGEGLYISIEVAAALSKVVRELRVSGVVNARNLSCCRVYPTSLSVHSTVAPYAHCLAPRERERERGILTGVVTRANIP